MINVNAKIEQIHFNKLLFHQIVVLIIDNLFVLQS